MDISRSVIDRVYTDIKFTYNTKMNHIVVPYSGHYNAISIDTVPSKKIHSSWCFNNSLSGKSVFSSCKVASFFSKNSTLHDTVRITRRKWRLRNLYKRKASSQKLNQQFKIESEREMQSKK